MEVPLLRLRHPRAAGPALAPPLLPAARRRSLPPLPPGPRPARAELADSWGRRPAPPAPTAATEGPRILPGEGRRSEEAPATAGPGKRRLYGRGAPLTASTRGWRRGSPAGLLLLLSGAAPWLRATDLLLLGRGGLGTLGRHGAAAAGRRAEDRRGRRDRRSSAQLRAAPRRRRLPHKMAAAARRRAGGTRLPPRAASPPARPRSGNPRQPLPSPPPDAASAAGHAGSCSPAPPSRARPRPQGPRGKAPGSRPVTGAWQGPAQGHGRRSEQAAGTRPERQGGSQARGEIQRLPARISRRPRSQPGPRQAPLPQARHQRKAERKASVLG
ncbi:serine/arginine repetitive matrix protein 3-like [Heliangelus exortis]|uniref:serine/arginine repetitive matrix protein 3-like n=1 Tax=Heliangelus exortis TaxID=472823 RepID=UPI003A906030